jgi:hypothetical protein
MALLLMEALVSRPIIVLSDGAQTPLRTSEALGI